MPVALADSGSAAVDIRDAASLVQKCFVGAESHGAAHVAIRLSLLQHVATHPFRHQTNDRILARSELCGVGAGKIGEVPRRLNHRHLHAEADAEIRHLTLTREARRLDLALGAALTEAAGHQDPVHAIEVLHGTFALEHL